MVDLYVPTEGSRNIQRRIVVLSIGVVCLFALLLFRMWYLQIVWDEYYTELSENNRVRVVPLQPRRGFIYDRNGALLATYMPSFNLYLILGDIPDKKRLLKKLSELLDLSPQEVERRLISRKTHIPYLPVKIKEGLSLKEVAILEVHKMELPGIRIEAEPQRHYLHGSLAAHILGYVGEITASQLKRSDLKGILPGTVIGQYGVEQIYDSTLRAKAGKMVIEVNALGHEVKRLKEEEPHPKHDLVLTIDLNLQKLAEEILGENAGAIVALDPNNGEILAITSHPVFDPNKLSTGLSGAEWQTLSQNPDKPLTNRAMQGQYPPGSIFKVVVASAALETEQIDTDFEVNCKGGLPFGGRIYRDWKRGGHGKVDLHSAIVYSCDVFFYQLGRMMGINPIADYAFSFGLGRPTGIELVSEKAGLIPTTEWKKEARQEPWYPGESLSAAIGQGFVTVTPLQMANVIGAIATSGLKYRPYLAKATRERSTGKVTEFAPTRLPDVDVSPETFKVLREALTAVVAEPRGTGRAAYSKDITIAGKTGTAQVVALKPGVKNKELPKEFQDHAWFVAFAPVENPQIAVAVLVEHGGQGGRVAAPLAKQIIEEFLKDDRPTIVDPL